MISRQTTILSLTGGLGNQLFQLAGGLHVSQGAPLLIDWKLAKPRLDSSNHPELESFVLPQNVSFHSVGKYSWLPSKATGYMLRTGISPTNFEKLPGYFYLSSLAAELIMSIHFKKFCRILVASGVGFFDIPNSSQGKYLVGYFQSFEWARKNGICEKVKNMYLADESSEVLRFKSLAQIECPLVVHIRLGDYKNEATIGMLSAKYYSKSIRKLWATGKYKKIWVFSDEPELARTILSDLPSHDIRWIPEIEGSAAKTLEVMRYGIGYVISNSSFSWWGAFISYAVDPEVIAPKPWFRKAPSPINIIPPDWETEIGW